MRPVTRPSIASSQANILIVDDHEANLLALEAILQPLGHRVVRAYSGEQALQRLLEQNFAVILMDVQMPGLDGYQTVSMIRQRESCRQVPIVFITAIHKSPENILEGYSCGAVDYILKPFEPFVLRSKVAVFVDLFLREQQLVREESALRERERQAEIRRSDYRLRNLIESLPLCVWAAKPDGNVHYCNRVWMEYTGMSPEETANLGFLEAVHPDFRKRVHRAWVESVQTGRSFEEEFPLRERASGEYRWHLGRAAPERYEGERLVGWIATAMEIDAKKKAEEERARLLAAEQDSRRIAEAANRMKDEFLATVSHELRNPLHAILGWARLVRSGKLEQTRLEHALETIERNALVQAKLIEDILDMSRIITGKLGLHVRPIKLSANIGAAMDTVRPAALAKRIQLEVTLDPLADDFCGDPDRLQQVVWNLLSNAIKFTPEGGRVELSVRRVDSEVELTVRDTGIGIDRDFLPHVFERFRQLDSTTTREYGGLGLGLAIVRHLVELHGGTVYAQSEGKEKGSTFIVRLPVGGALPSPKELLAVSKDDASSSVEKLPRLDGTRVLFVDDHQDARLLMTELLEGLGAQVIAVESVDAALNALAVSRPDVLLSDIGLPHRDGYSLIRGVRALPKGQGRDVPAIAVTGFASSKDGEHALAAGFQHYLTKPIDTVELIDAITKLTSRLPKGEGPSTGSGHGRGDGALRSAVSAIASPPGEWR